jgi:hypothetical protein
VSSEDLENYETEMELQLYREYRDIAAQFSYVVETERRFYLTNDVDLQPRNADGEVYFELTMRDAWVWDMYRPARFVKTVRVVTFKDVNIYLEPRRASAPSTTHRRAPVRASTGCAAVHRWLACAPMRRLGAAR